MLRISQATGIVLVYNVVIEDNIPWMILEEVEYNCYVCNKNAYVDFKPVPPQYLALACNNCTTTLICIKENQFQVELIPFYDED